QYFKRFNAKNPECGGAKKANTPKLLDERKLELKDQRDRWEKLCNSHLELAGSDARISMKSLEEQGIDREPINLSMKQIKTPSIKSVYEHQLKLSIDLKQIEKDSQAINVDDELIRVY
ncbi:MobA/MobL family protein, partial [Paraburkholderia sp. SIMBA_049]